MNFSDKVKYVRMKQQLSQEALAKEIGIGRATLCRWEYGSAEPRLVALGKFVDYCEKHGIIFEGTTDNQMEPLRQSDTIRTGESK